MNPIIHDSELNSDKTEVVLFGPERFRERLSSYISALDVISLASSTTERNLGVISDQDLSSDAHIKQVLPYFTSVILLKSGTSCLRVMQRNCSMHLLLQTELL